MIDESGTGWKRCVGCGGHGFVHADYSASEIDRLLEERRDILRKGRLLKADRKRLDELDEWLVNMPLRSESAEDVEARDLIREAAAALDAQAKGERP